MSARKLIKLGALEPKQTAFLLCDIQETFRAHIKFYDEVVRVANKMIEAANVFEIPVYVSEQYPKGLGHTTKDIKLDKVKNVYEKTKFSMYTPELQKMIKQDMPDLKSVILFGIESHVCIEQTAIDLMNEDIAVHVLADGVSSRSLMDRQLAFDRMRDIGCFVTTSENVLFKLLRDKNSPAFKSISKMNQEPTKDTIGYDKLAKFRPSIRSLRVIEKRKSCVAIGVLEKQVVNKTTMTAATPIRIQYFSSMKRRLLMLGLLILF